MKLHLCCGSTYLKGYENCDINGKVYGVLSKNKFRDNPNATTLDKYFLDSFEPDRKKRKPREFIIDMKMDILELWPWKDEVIDEIVMINAWEHFTNHDEMPFIKNEIMRVLKPGGKFIVNFPNVKMIVDRYYDSNPEYCMELLYCNHKNQYSIHHWGYTPKSFKKLWPDSYKVKRKTVVKCDHPMISMEVTKNE